MKTLSKIFVCLMLVVAFAGPVLAVAQDGGPTTTPTVPPPNLPINPGLPIPNAVLISGEGGQGPAGLVANFYSFAFLLAGFLAFVMIVYGGVRYTFSAGNHSAQSEAKDAIKQALLGLGLLLVAYMILRTINPDLTNLRLPTLEPYKPPVSAPTGGIGAEGEIPTDDPTCGLALKPIAPEAQPFEGGSRVSFSSNDSNVQRNLTYLRVQEEKAHAALAARGAFMRVNSVYRPFSYQEHLYDVWSLSKTLAANPAVAEKCEGLKAEVDEEMRDHQLIGSTVARPNKCAPHVMGRAMDITLTNITHAEAEELFRQSGVDLDWRAIPGDEAHYEAQNYPWRCS